MNCVRDLLVLVRACVGVTVLFRGMFAGSDKCGSDRKQAVYMMVVTRAIRREESMH